MSDRRSEILARINKAASFSEQREAVLALAAYDQNQADAVQRERDLDWSNMVVHATLAPAPGHEVERSPMDTGWLGDFEASNDPNAKHAVLAEASMWFDRVSREVKADPEEFGIQAEGFMRREASKHGLQASAVYTAGLEFLGSRWRQAASGLPQVQQTVDSHDNPSATPLPQDVFDNFAPAVAPDNVGVVGTETSDRAPLIQQILQQGQGEGSAEWPSQHSESADFSNSYGDVPPGSPQDASSGPLEPQEDEDRDYSNPEFGTATASLVDGPSVAINQTMTLDDFRREAASGLDEIQQTVDPEENPKPTPLPQDVMFAWLIGPDAYGNGGDQGAAKNASRKQATPNGGCDANHVYHEMYGTLTRPQLAAYRKHNISPSDHDSLVDEYGEHGHKAIINEIKRQTANGGGFSFLNIGGGRYASKRTQAAGGNGYAAGSPAWFDEEARPATKSPDQVEKERLFPDGIPLHGDLTPEQQAWLDGPRKNKRASVQSQAVVEDPFGSTDLVVTSTIREAAGLRWPQDGEEVTHEAYGVPLTVRYDSRPAIGDNNFQVPGHTTGVYTVTGPNGSKRFEHGPMSEDNTWPAMSARDQALQHMKSTWMQAKRKQGSRKQADMFGGDEGVEHPVPQPDVANTPATTPNEQAGYTEGQADALAGQRPTFADASTGAPGNVSQYSKGYSDAANAAVTNPDVPHSLSNQASLRFTSAATAQHPDFVRGYAFAAKWRPGQRLVSLGSGKFEEGLYAGLADYPAHREAWRAAHRRSAAKHPQMAQRTAQHDAYTDYLASQGIDVLAPKQAGTSTDLESTGPGSSASPDGSTFINGPGTTPPLINGGNPASPGGPAPYNGAEPLGAPAVPNGPTAPPAREQTINDLPGGPVDQNRPMDNPTLAAFRKRVAANLAAQKG